jgi:hypothetical protein
MPKKNKTELEILEDLAKQLLKLEGRIEALESEEDDWLEKEFQKSSLGLLLKKKGFHNIDSVLGYLSMKGLLYHLDEVEFLERIEGSRPSYVV